MDAETLLEVIKCGETSVIQFKEALDDDVMAAEIIAMANARGGTILLGIKDKTGAITGLDYTQLQTYNNRLAAIASDKIKPQIFITTETILTADGRVLAVNVPEGINKPYKDKNGAIWIKQGSDKRRLLDNTEILRLFQSGGHLLADEMEVYDTSIDDVDERLFAEYFLAEFKQTYQEKMLSFEHALRVKKVLRQQRLTLAGLLFFGRAPQSVKPACTIKAVSFWGNDIAGNHYRSKPEDFKGTIPELFKQGMLFLKSSLRHLQKTADFNSPGVLEISEIALWEVLQNALIHRDYLKNSPVRLLIYDNRVELISPGCLPNSLTVEEARYGNPVIRNNQIALFGMRTLPYSGLGSGLRRAISEQPDLELINDVTGEQFIVRIPRPEN